MRRASLAGVIVVSLIIGAGLGAGGLYGYQRWSENQGTDARPDFSLPDLQGKQHNIAEWDGKLVVLNFWASWCPPCVREIPMFVDLQKQYGDRGLQFIGVAVDRHDAAQAFVKDKGVNYPILQGMQSAMEVGALYGNDAGTLPYTVVINRHGRIVTTFSQEVHRKLIESVIQNHL